MSPLSHSLGLMYMSPRSLSPTNFHESFTSTLFRLRCEQLFASAFICAPFQYVLQGPVLKYGFFRFFSSYKMILVVQCMSVDLFRRSAPLLLPTLIDNFRSNSVCPFVLPMVPIDTAIRLEIDWTVDQRDRGGTCGAAVFFLSGPRCAASSRLGILPIESHGPPRHFFHHL